MGLFWTTFYVINVVAPLFAGYLAGITGGASTAFDLGAVSLFLGCGIFATFTLVSGAAPRIALTEPV